MYVGPIVLKDNIDIAVYEHFLLFHVGISILVSDKHISEFSLKYVKKILTFIQHSENIYGRQFLIYNVHLLSHLTDDVDIFGPLDEFSTFPFENYLGKLKTYVKSPTNPLQQIFRRLTENYALPLNKMKSNSLIKLMYSHNLGPLHSSILHTHCKQYKKVTFHDIVFSIDSSVDCYCIITENILIRILNIIQLNDNIFFIGTAFKGCEPLYKYPLDSRKLKICIYHTISDEIKIWPLNLIIAKCIVFSYCKKSQNCWVSFPLIHSIL